jgi:hypothetical protein
MEIELNKKELRFRNVFISNSLMSSYLLFMGPCKNIASKNITDKNITGGQSGDSSPDSDTSKFLKKYTLFLEGNKTRQQH